METMIARRLNGDYDRSSIEWRLAERQLQVKSYSSNSWFIDINKICIKYGILDPYKYLENPLSKIECEKLIKKQVHSYWREKIQEGCLTFSTLKFPITQCII